MDAELLIRIINRSASEEEEKEFGEWLKISEENEKEYLEIKEIWEKTAPVPPSDIKSEEEGWKDLRERIEKSKVFYIKEHTWKERPVKRRTAGIGEWLVRIAAVLVIGVGIHFWLEQQAPIIDKTIETETHEPVNRIFQRITRKGERAIISLGDGTIVHLNSGSLLRYPQFFDKNERKVELRGEAYFSVASDTERPFRVKLRNNVVEVLGTEFNIRNRRGENFDLVVVKGKVKTYKENTDNDILLKKGEMVKFDSRTGYTSPRKVDIENFIAWKRNKLFFDNLPLEEVMKEIEYCFNVDTHFKINRLRKNRISGVFSTDSLDAVLKAISLSLDLDIQRKGKHIYIE